MSDLFGAPEPKRRKANKNDPTPADEITIHLVLRKSERAAMRAYDGGGGLQQLCTDLVEQMDNHPQTGNGRYHLDLDKDTTWRLVRYINNTGGGGPNDSLRAAFHRYFRDGSGW